TIIKKELEKIKRINFFEPDPIDKKEIELVHSKEYLTRLESLSTAGAVFPDNVFSKNTFDIALLSAAAAKSAAMNCTDNTTFALVRPPGHHAGREFFGGFCYINNIAFAAKSLQKYKGWRGMIIDIDYHHGNGTQDIFKNDESIFYLSLHADPRYAYPRTGFESENNSHIKNIPLPLDTSDLDHIKKFEKNMKECSKLFDPEFIAVSAGFDTYSMDPIAGLQINKIETYRRIGERIASLRLPTFIVLEGGYYLRELGRMVASFVSGF
ncbi:MAG: hypothetical protein QW112_02980, partial [Candidatus Micrarchaeia archaeon]